MTIMNAHDMERVISEITLSRARADPSACIRALNPLLNTAEGRKFLPKQEGDKALLLIELLDWGLRSHGIPLNKGCVLWTLRQLCACQETLPSSCVLQIEFKTSDPHHAAGGFADVWRGVYQGKEVAFKSIRGSTLANDAERLKRKRRFCKEVVLWKSLNHPNILRLVGVCRWDNTPDTRLTMVSEWMSNGNITEFIKHNDSQRMQLLVDCAKGVQYLHGVNLAHGDLKGANILVTSDKPVRALLADFGFMTIAYDDASGPGTTSAQGGGTTPFMAPELLSPSMFRKTKCQVSREADVYAFGMVILQVLTGLMPFQLLRETEISYKVIQGERPQRPGKDSGISNELWQLLNRCWSANCAERPQIVEILQRLCVEPARGLIFPPSKVAPAPSCESEFPSATQRYAEIFHTANVQTPIDECPPFPMPASPIDAEHSSNETRSSASWFGTGNQDVTPPTSPGHSQIVEEPKPPVPEALSRTVSSGSDTATIDDQVTPRHVLGLGVSPLFRGLDLSKHAYDKNQHDPTTYDTQPLHVDLTEIPIPARGITSQASPRSDLPGMKPQLARIMTNPPLESRNSDSPGTSFLTPTPSGDIGDHRPFDSAVSIQVEYSRSGPSRDTAASPRKVVGVHQLGDKRSRSKHSFPGRSLEPPRRKRSNPRPDIVSPVRRASEAMGVGPRHGLRISLTPPSRSARRNSNSKQPRRRGDSTLSFSSSPFDEFHNDTSTPEDIPEATASTAPGTQLGSQLKSKLPSRDKKRAVPAWGGGEGRGGAGREEKGKGRELPSYTPTPTDYVSVVSNQTEDRSRDQDLTPRSSKNPSFIQVMFARLGVRKSSSLLRPPPPSKRVLTQAQMDTPASTTAVPATSTGSANVPPVGLSGRDRERSLSRHPSLASLVSTRTKNGGNKRSMRLAIRNVFGDHVGPDA